MLAKQVKNLGGEMKNKRFLKRSRLSLLVLATCSIFFFTACSSDGLEPGEEEKQETGEEFSEETDKASHTGPEESEDSEPEISEEKTEEETGTETNEKPEENELSELATEEHLVEANPSDSDENASEDLSKDGEYFSILAPNSDGEFDQQGFGTVADIRIEENSFIIDGSLNYTEQVGMGVDLDSEKLDHANYAFAIDENTKLTAISGLADQPDFTEEEFLDYFEECRGTGLGLVIQVENGIATSIAISS